MSKKLVGDQEQFVPSRVWSQIDIPLQHDIFDQIKFSHKLVFDGNQSLYTAMPQSPLIFPRDVKSPQPSKEVIRLKCSGSK